MHSKPSVTGCVVVWGSGNETVEVLVATAAVVVVVRVL